MVTPRTGLGVAVVNRLMYALGGYDGSCRLRTAECYHPEEDSWTPIPAMTTPRSGVGECRVPLPPADAAAPAGKRPRC